jgi:hypothetical protein
MLLEDAYRTTAVHITDKMLATSGAFQLVTDGWKSRFCADSAQLVNVVTTLPVTNKNHRHFMSVTTLARMNAASMVSDMRLLSNAATNKAGSKAGHCSWPKLSFGICQCDQRDELHQLLCVYALLIVQVQNNIIILGLSCAAA